MNKFPIRNWQDRWDRYKIALRSRNKKKDEKNKQTQSLWIEMIKKASIVCSKKKSEKKQNKKASRQILYTICLIFGKFAYSKYWYRRKQKSSSVKKNPNSNIINTMFYCHFIIYSPNMFTQIQKKNNSL